MFIGRSVVIFAKGIEVILCRFYNRCLRIAFPGNLMISLTLTLDACRILPDMKIDRL